MGIADTEAFALGRLQSPLLTVAVPTFNRSQHLATFLEAAAPQLMAESCVELLISDNASSDDTTELVRRFQKQGVSIRYVRNETNLGADGNILQCFQLAVGKYVWICGDDDVIEPLGLSKVLNYLRSDDELDIVSLQARGFTGAYATLPQRAKERVARFNRAEDLAAHVHVFFTFISGIIVNKERIMSVPHPPFEELLGTSLVQLSWTYTALEHHRRSLVIRTPLIATLANNTGGYALFEVFATTLKRITEKWLSSTLVREEIYRGALLAFFPWFLIKSKVGPGFKKENPQSILKKEFNGFFNYWAFNYPILNLPRPLGIAWLWMVRLVNRADRALGRPLVRW